MDFRDFPSVQSYLDSLVNYEHKFPLGGNRSAPKLEPTLAAIDRCGLSRQLENCVHIAGTKGKGTVVLLLEQLLCPDVTVLSFSSPHLISVKERVRLNGGELDDSVWAEGFSGITDAIRLEPRISLTYFESVWVFYLWASKKFQPDVHVVEAGLGGSWDATNVLTKSVAVLTLVDYDHTEILGSTLTEIATDKSGIIKQAGVVIVARQPDEAQAVYEHVVHERDARGKFFSRDFDWRNASGNNFDYADEFGSIPQIAMPSAADYLKDNASVAIRAAREVCQTLTEKSIRERLANSVLPGRQELLPGKPPVMLDVAHNPVSFAALAATLRREYSANKIRAVIGMMKDKDANACLAHLKGLIQELRIVDLGNPRSMKAKDLAQIARNLGIDADVSDMHGAFNWLHEPAQCDLGLVCGSFYLAGDYINWRKIARTS